MTFFGAADSAFGVENLWPTPTHCLDFVTHHICTSSRDKLKFATLHIFFVGEKHKLQPLKVVAAFILITPDAIMQSVS